MWGPNLSELAVQSRLTCRAAKLIGRLADIVLECHGLPDADQQIRISQIKRELDNIEALLERVRGLIQSKSDGR